jgi:mannosylfructose-phosphate synthase
MSPRRDSKLKRIAHLSTHGYVDPAPQLGRTDTGGQVVYVLELAKALSTLGIAVDIYTRWFDRERKQIDPLLDHPGARVIRIPAGPWEFIPKERIYDVLPELSENMLGFIRENELEYDLYHGHYVDAGDVTLEVARRMGRPAFFTAHSIGAWKREQMGGDPEEMERDFNFERRIADELNIFRSVTAQSFTTEVQKEKVKELYGWEADNAVVIPPGVNVHTFGPPEPGDTKQETGLPEKYVFCLSRIDSNKGLDFLLHAFDLVKNEIFDVHLVIGGGSPTPGERERGVFSMMRDIIEKKGMQDRVSIVGYVPDESLAPYYQQAKMFVLPSLYEPFGMTALEAMACNRPVVASRLGGIRTVITSGESGLLVDPSNSNEFAGAMIRLLQDPALGDRLGRAGREIVVGHFSWEAIAERYVAMYEAYIADKG